MLDLALEQEGIEELHDEAFFVLREFFHFFELVEQVAVAYAVLGLVLERPVDQEVRGNIQGLCEPVENLGRGFCVAPLVPAYIAVMHIGKPGELLLREFLVLACIF